MGPMGNLPAIILPLHRKATRRRLLRGMGSRPPLRDNRRPLDTASGRLPLTDKRRLQGTDKRLLPPTVSRLLLGTVSRLLLSSRLPAMGHLRQVSPLRQGKAERRPTTGLPGWRSNSAFAWRSACLLGASVEAMTTAWTTQPRTRSLRSGSTPASPMRRLGTLAAISHLV